MSDNPKWIRVTKDHPCSVCGHKDWDTYNPELKFACCMRIKSDKPAKNGGWLHPLTDDAMQHIPPREEKPIKQIDCAALWRTWRDKTNPEDVEELSIQLGVTMESLDELGCAWSPEHRAWAFPMCESNGKIVGIRLRTSSGKKFAVTGSHQGLFFPDCAAGNLIHITEGPTDTAAALSMGCYAIGRPSCQGCEQMIIDFIVARKIRRVVICADSDTPGIRGAEKLQAMLPVPSIIWIPPCKDLRKFLNNGGTRHLINSMIADLIWNQPKKI